MSEIESFLNNFPWANLAAFFAAILGAVTLSSVLAARWGPFRKRLRGGIQDILGIKQVNDALTSYVADRREADATLERSMQKTIDAQQSTQAQLQNLTELTSATAIALGKHIRNNTRHNPSRRQRPRNNPEASA